LKVWPFSPKGLASRAGGPVAWAVVPKGAENALPSVELEAVMLRCAPPKGESDGPVSEKGDRAWFAGPCEPRA